MENLILIMMKKAKVSEEELRAKKIISTSFGDPLSWALIGVPAYFIFTSPVFYITRPSE